MRHGFGADSARLRQSIRQGGREDPTCCRSASAYARLAARRGSAGATPAAWLSLRVVGRAATPDGRSLRCQTSSVVRTGLGGLSRDARGA